MTTEEYLALTTNERVYVVGYITDAGGGVVFNSVGDLGQEVQYYAETELVDFSTYPIITNGEFQAMIDAGVFGAGNKFVATVQAMQNLGRL